MGIDLTSAAAGAVIGAVAGDVYEEGKEHAKEATGQSTVQHDGVETAMLVDIMSRLEKAWDEVRARNCPPTGKSEMFYAEGYGEPYVYRRRNYKHVSLLCPAAVNLDVNTPVGVIQFAFNKGWNPFDMPDNSRVLVSTGGQNSIKLYVYWSDDVVDMAGV